MKGIIFGNGLNIKFGGKAYFNGKILRRGFSLLQQKKDVYSVVPPETLDFFKEMYKSVPDIIDGLYDNVDTSVKVELKHFKENYILKDITDIGSIGMEDYFLVLHLIFQYNRNFYRGTDNEMYYNVTAEQQAAECFRDLCLLGIYNGGKLDKLHTRYSAKFIEYINQFDSVFTTNYDVNLDAVYRGSVQHIHGQFDVLDQRYDPLSFRNMLSDNQFNKNNLINPEKYLFLHSTALMDYSGQHKFDKLMAEKNLNNITVQEIMKVPDSMVNIESKELAIEAKNKQKENPSLEFQYSKALEKYMDFSGELSIIGLSASNDNHIFVNHKKVKYMYYYYSAEDLKLAKRILPNGSIYKPVQELWDSFSS
ncbi:hypothetical protein CG419_09960 [Latilactobacillus curvatus]|uniref:Uncharacterized protein n=1 Tax=Latilactobacillus curvatus TaxID=28038 RepID=A0AAC9UT88_LATCU|nr:hypothetical protein [Latilactobacillus curvatus]ASN60922.1 hypothetical protein CG419_09960 [Latilactobacillus curvatus]